MADIDDLLAAMEASAAEQGLALGESCAYGNGGEDVPYLETVGRPPGPSTGDCLDS